MVTIEKSLEALDRAFKKLGPKKLAEIVAKIDAMPSVGPTAREYLAYVSNAIESKICIAYPESEHHTSGYRTDLGYFKSSLGVEYQLGMTDTRWNKENGYACDFTLHGKEGGDYTSGKLNNTFVVFNTDEPCDEWRVELIKRAIEGGYLNKDLVI
jgi:hypothetical protein